MLSIAFALAATLTATPAAAPTQRSMGPIMGSYHVDRGTYCVRSGWNTATLETNRRVRAGDCRTAAEWRRRGIAFDEAVAAQIAQRKTADADQVAAR